MNFADTLKLVKDKLKNSSGVPLDRAVDALVEQELAIRTDTMRRAIDLYREATGKLNAIRPQSPGCDPQTMQPLPAMYTTAQVKERKSLEETIAGLDTALLKAVGEADYDLLTKKVGSAKSAM